MRRNPNALCHDLHPSQWNYRLPNDRTVSLAEIHACWVFKAAKPQAYGGLLLMAPIYELWPWRLFRYRGYGDDLGQWDTLKISMDDRGWDLDRPLPLGLAADNCALVHDGNHRLQIARELGMTHVPVALAEFTERTDDRPCGIKPYLQQSASYTDSDALWCDPFTFARALGRISSEAYPYDPKERRTWQWLVREVIDECKALGRFGREYQRLSWWYRSPGSGPARRKRLWQLYLEWVDTQRTYMAIAGVTWPLKHVWPHVDEDELEADMKALKGSKPEWLNREELARWYAGRLYVDPEEIEKYVRERRQAERATWTDEQREEHDRTVDEIMKLLI